LENKKKLRFENKLVSLVLSGKKYVTWRLFDDKNLQKGDNLELINSEISEKFSEAIIEEIREKKFKELNEEDFNGHEKFSSKEEMYKTYLGYYGEQFSPETIVKIIRFKLIK